MLQSVFTFSLSRVTAFVISIDWNPTEIGVSPGHIPGTTVSTFRMHGPWAQAGFGQLARLGLQQLLSQDLFPDLCPCPGLSGGEPHTVVLPFTAEPQKKALKH